MRTLLSFFCFFIVVALFAQSKSKIVDHSKYPPIYYIDSIEVGKRPVGVDVNSIIYMTVDNKYSDSAMRINGKIYLTTKKKYVFYNVADILARYNVKVDNNMVFMFDGVLIKDTSSLKIDSSYIIKVVTTVGAASQYLKKILPELSFVNMLTKEHPADTSRNLIIRGKEVVF